MFALCVCSYEGTGRSLSLKLIDELRKKCASSGSASQSESGATAAASELVGFMDGYIHTSTNSILRTFPGHCYTHYTMCCKCYTACVTPIMLYMKNNSEQCCNVL